MQNKSFNVQKIKINKCSSNAIKIINQWEKNNMVSKVDPSQPVVMSKDMCIIYQH